MDQSASFYPSSFLQSEQSLPRVEGDAVDHILVLDAGEPAAEAPVPDGGRVVLAPRGHEAVAGVEVDVESTSGAREALVTRVGHIEKPEH